MKSEELESPPHPDAKRKDLLPAGNLPASVIFPLRNAGVPPNVSLLLRKEGGPGWGFLAKQPLVPPVISTAAEKSLAVRQPSVLASATFIRKGAAGQARRIRHGEEIAPRWAK